MSNAISDELIVCASCEYRYPRSEGICPMCGTEPLRPLWAVPDEFGRRDHKSDAAGSNSPQRPPKPRLWRLIPVVAVLIVLMAVTSFFYKSHTGNLPKKSGAAAQLPGASEQIKLENAGERDIVPDSVKPDPVVSDRVVSDRVKKVQHVAAEKLGTPLTAASEQVKFKNAGQQDTVHDPVTGVHRVGAGKLRSAQTTNVAKENDPVELWKAVKGGSVSAEVALANLYLEGEAVTQNCEQAHMLLHAASMKGSKAADDSLKSSYAGRCE